MKDKNSKEVKKITFFHNKNFRDILKKKFMPVGEIEVIEAYPYATLGTLMDEYDELVVEALGRINRNLEYDGVAIYYKHNDPNLNHTSIGDKRIIDKTGKTKGLHLILVQGLRKIK